MLVADGVATLIETGRFEFVLEPEEPDWDYRISVGDVPLVDIAGSPHEARGVRVAGRVFWPALPYFDSARGITPVLVERRRQDANHGMWDSVLTAVVNVLPEKLGDDRYWAMARQLETVSRGLLVDLYGKSTQSVDLRLSSAGTNHRSSEEELASIETTMTSLWGLLTEISRSPASRTTTQRRRRLYWGQRSLSTDGLATLVRTGSDPRRSPRPIRVMERTRRETFDVPEHRIVRAFLEALLWRSERCARVASAHIRAIQEERPLRDVRLREGPTLYEIVDLPRLERLGRAIERADRCRRLVWEILELPMLKDVPAASLGIKGDLFQRGETYRRLMLVIRRFMNTHARAYDGGRMVLTTKLTWRMFEQWVFLRIVEAFRAAGVQLREWSRALRENLHSRFTIDFDRGLEFGGELGDGSRIRFRYEPWVLGQDAALRVGESLYRGRSGEAGWCPDVLIEYLRLVDNLWVSVYAIVLDCKYSGRIVEHHWTGVSKYLEIRSTGTGRQVARQLWLVGPAADGSICCEDPEVEFGPGGPTCGIDEAVRFRMAVTPDSEIVGDREDIFQRFASGTIEFLRSQASSEGRRTAW